MFIRACLSAIIVLSGALVFTANAQQQLLYSHYYWNEQAFNPAYAGSKDALQVQALYRKQWTGIEGAPQTISAAVHSPLKNDRFALGVNLYNDKIGATASTGFTFQYAYRLPITDRFKLSMGIQAGMEFSNIDQSKLVTDDGLPDPVQANWNVKSLMPIVGAGIYFYGKQFSVGVGIPQLISGGMLKEDAQAVSPVNHYFISGAYQYNINDDFRLLPTMNLRFNAGAPVQAEVQLSTIMYDMFLAGVGVRTDKSAIFLAQFMPSLGKEDSRLKFHIGYAYDMAWKQLRVNTGGSHEIFLSCKLPGKTSGNTILKIQSPRYF